MDLLDGRAAPSARRRVRRGRAGKFLKSDRICPDEDLFWGYHFVTGALMLTLGRTGRIDRLSGGLCKSDDFTAIKQRMASFMAAGFLEICGKKKASPR